MISGISQIVFNSNPVCGILLVVAVLVASPVQAVSCIWAVLIVTALVCVTRIPMEDAKSGLYTFNPALIGLAIPMVTGCLDFAEMPRVLAITAVGAVITFALQVGLRKILNRWGVGVLGLPYSLALTIVCCVMTVADGVMTVAGGGLTVGGGVDVAAAGSVTGGAAADGVVRSAGSFVEAFLSGTAQIVWLEGVPLVPIAAIIILIAVCCASRTDVFMSMLCGALATGFAIILGAVFPGVDGAAISAGLYGYNAMLLSYVLFGRTYKIGLRSFVITIILTLATVPFAMGLKPLMALMGAPVAGFPFSIIGILAMLVKPAGWEKAD